MRVLELGAARLARLVVVVVHTTFEVLAHRVARVLLRTQRRLGLVHLLVRVKLGVRVRVNARVGAEVRGRREGEGGARGRRERG